MFLYVYSEEIKSRCHYSKPITDGSLNLKCSLSPWHEEISSNPILPEVKPGGQGTHDVCPSSG